VEIVAQVATKSSSALSEGEREIAKRDAVFNAGVVASANATAVLGARAALDPF
jgi:hypothetical protein